jgi:hypothetical protein
MDFWQNEEQAPYSVGSATAPYSGGYTTMPKPTTSPYQTQIPSAMPKPYQAPQPISPGATLQQKSAPYQAPPLQPSAPAPAPRPAAPAAPAYNSSAWNTDGYAAPSYLANRANAKAIPGWDMRKWQDANHQTPKYVVGRILSQFAPTTESLPHAFQEIQRAYPQATFNGKDKIDLDGAGPMGPVDVLQGAGSGGRAWRWGANDGAAKTAQGGQGDILSALLGLASGGFNEQPQQPAFDQNAFLEQLQKLFSQYQTPQANGPRIVWG